MVTLTQILAVVGILANGIVYGTDFFCALVQRSALANVDDAMLTKVMGEVHRFGDKRMPAPGVVGLVTALACAVVAGVGGHTAAAVAAGVGTVALVAWLVVYAKVSAPVNKALTTAADEGTTLPNARALQATWDGVINLRVALQLIGVLGLCIALIKA
ncbi:DUF1772 domain-containing protein [Streptacidiphilus fuscans]|uniref:DUF1772 domain-containing protein n=1 Tax=Streptacidiphilus fuscans TaxID=2789292 RepID=A0A931B4H9_9ACTN|nr:DUF1772 domain-containing protein [Streptacidiphilus fuscans]MBF9066750.1 DUF1772 domain-containing protein [Streptacidiphilus fuscans]